ncbi:neprilysin-2-like [Sitophilus oryzae]|uniref:Neprilysin-2-like n=1 Tax=Sitophilus oryzae TaxID=7048 RepID=A0A6J2YW37_SITOR|nr:neprilysin-2-like [Sitophilus oryzae]
MDNEETIIKPSNEQNGLKELWDRHSKYERKVIIWFLALIGASVVIFLLCFFLIPGNPVICETADCRAASNEIQNYIDPYERPCDDFYNFACGMFTRNFSYDDSYLYQSVKLIMEENIQHDVNELLQEPPNENDLPAFNLAKKFYRACMHEKAVEDQDLRKIKQIFIQMGGWPLLQGPNWVEEDFHFLKPMRKLRSMGLNVDFFLNITLEPDKENTERYILTIHDKFYSPSEISPNSKAAFLDYMVDVASQFDAMNANIWKEQRDVLDFLLNLARISEESRKSNQTHLYNPYTLSELQHEFPSIPWLEYIQSVLGNAAILHYDDIVTVSEPVYLKKLENLLRNTEARILANFISWQTLQYLINFLPSKVLDKAYDYLRKVNGKYDKVPRWKMCVEASRNRLSSAINLAYIDRYFDDKLKANVTSLIRNVKSEFRKNLVMLNWLDEDTKKKVVRTLLSSVEKIFSYNDFIDIIEENNVYQGVEIDENKLLEAVLTLDSISLDLQYGLLRKPVKDNWVKTQQFLSGLKVVYSPTENKLKFPLGLFRGIYYNGKRPEYMNYGLLGTVLAHQISHIFVEARAYHVGVSDSNTQRLYSWWSSSSLNKYIQKVECLSNQYARLELRDYDDIRTNTLITRDEDVADLAGLKIAYATYLEYEWRNGKEPQLPGLKYTPRQLFWISSALQFCSKYSVRYMRDKYTRNKYNHSPNEIRVNGPLRNLEEFAYDFGCPVGSYMNPVKKCHIW